MTRSSLLRSSALLGLAMGGFAVLPAGAQVADDVATRDVVIVSATRRDENIQDIPINIAAVGAEQIEEQG